MSDWRVLGRTIAELVFKEENFAMGSAKQDMDGNRSNKLDVY